MIKNPKIENFKVKEVESYPYIEWAEIEAVLGKRKYNSFIKWMYGQTVPIGGVYIWDLERWLNGYPCTD